MRGKPVIIAYGHADSISGHADSSSRHPDSSSWQNCHSTQSLLVPSSLSCFLNLMIGFNLTPISLSLIPKLHFQVKSNLGTRLHVNQLSIASCLLHKQSRMMALLHPNVIKFEIWNNFSYDNTHHWPMNRNDESSAFALIMSDEAFSYLTWLNFQLQVSTKTFLFQFCNNKYSTGA